ncbi:MAG TPA: DNA polymerase I [Phycisphaerales bacterium]|nr:DNA polymerase I [Phycisphaerales bacterium]
MAKNLYIIDGHAHIYAAYYAPMRPLTSPSGEPTKASYIFTTALLGLIDRNAPDMLVVTMDSKAPSFRCKIYPEYKAHRSPMPEDMPVQIQRIEEILNAMKIPVLRLDGYEADDIIGTLSTQASLQGIDTYICSKDKDMLQLLDEHVSTYDIKKDKKTTPQSLQEDMGVTPEQFLDCLALQGDTADNIPGIPDVGPKTALDWIKKYGSIENLYAHADEIKGKRGDNLRSSKDLAFLCKELVTIDRNTPIEIDFDSFAVSEPDKQTLGRLFTELGFTRLLTSMGIEQDEKDAAETGSAKKFVKKDYQLIDTPEAFDIFLKDLKKQKIFAVDTETTSVNAMKADLVGMSFCWQGHKAYYLPVKASLGQKTLDIHTLRKQLGPILADENVKKIGQNIKYDMLILSNARMPVKGVYFDTMVASYCLEADRYSHSMDAMSRDYLGYEPIPISALIGKGKNQLTFDMVDTTTAAEYAAEDADVTFLLYEYLKEKLDAQPDIKGLFEDVEMPLVSVLAQMEINGVSLDTKLLRNMSTSMAETLDEITEKIYEMAGTVFNVSSPKQLAEILFDRLGMESVRSGKTSRSTDAAVLDQLRDQHDIIPLILQYRQLVKLKNTYVDKLGQLINPRTGRVHASFNQTITATGRLSSSNPNLQNIPIRTELGRKIRSAFIPEKEDDCILSADYSQIELRLLASLSGDKAMLKAFVEDQDIHSFVASQIYAVDLGDVTSEMRSHSKAVNFGIIYGQGPFGLARSIGVTQARAKQFIENYFARYSSIRQFMDDAIAQAEKTGFAETILCRRRRILDITSKNKMKRSQAERFVINTIIQGSAADLIKVAMINIQNRIDRENMPVRMTLQIHDELVFEVPKDNAQEHAKWISQEMTTAIKLDVPLKVDVAIGPSWLDEK